MYDKISTKLWMFKIERLLLTFVLPGLVGSWYVNCVRKSIVSVDITGYVVCLNMVPKNSKWVTQIIEYKSHMALEDVVHKHRLKSSFMPLRNT